MSDNNINAFFYPPDDKPPIFTIAVLVAFQTIDIGEYINRELKANGVL